MNSSKWKPSATSAKTASGLSNLWHCQNSQLQVLISVKLLDYPGIVAGEHMTNQELVNKVEELLSTGKDLDFLLVLRRKDLEKLVACIRGRVDQAGVR